MKNTAYIVISCLSALVLASCVKDDLYNTPHPDKGALVVTADFSERTEGNAIPDTYVFSVDGKTCDANSAEPFYYPELLPAGVHKLVAYNEPAGMSFTDNVVSVDVLQDGTIEPLPQYLYSYSGSVEAVVDDTVRVTMPMEQRVRDLYLRFNITEGDVARLASVNGTISGAAGAFDVAGGTVTGTAVEVVPDFVVDGNSVDAHVRLLGIIGSKQTLSLNIVFTDGRVEARFSAGGVGGIEEVDGTRGGWTTAFDQNIGIIAYTESGEIFNGYSNVEYRQIAGRFDAVGDGIYYSANPEERIKFSAYYPYQELTDGNIYKVDLTQAYDGGNILLWTGMTADSYNKESGVVALDLQRMYSTVRILLEAGDGYNSDDLDGAALTISDMPLKADFNVRTGETTVTESGAMSFAYRVSAGYYVWTLPTVANADRVVTVTLASGDTYKWQIPDKTFEGGHFYEYHLRVNKINSLFSLTIEDRTDEIMGIRDYIDL